MSDKEVLFGTVVFFGSKSKDKKHNNYGFIARPNLPDLFVHWSDISDMEGYKTLKEGQKVSFQLGTNHNGQPKAINVKVINEDSSASSKNH